MCRHHAARRPRDLGRRRLQARCPGRSASAWQRSSGRGRLPWASARPRRARSIASTSITPPRWPCAARSARLGCVPHHVIVDGSPIRTLGDRAHGGGRRGRQVLRRRLRVDRRQGDARPSHAAAGPALSRLRWEQNAGLWDAGPSRRARPAGGHRSPSALVLRPAAHPGAAPCPRTTKRATTRRATTRRATTRRATRNWQQPARSCRGTRLRSPAPHLTVQHPLPECPAHERIDLPRGALHRPGGRRDRVAGAGSGSGSARSSPR